MIWILASACTSDPSPISGVTPPGVTDSPPAPTETGEEGGEGADSPIDTGEWTPPVLPDPKERYRFAVIGDFGSKDEDEAEVAAAVISWDPDFVLTVGDNNYYTGDEYDDVIGQYYHPFIHPYAGKYGKGAKENRFWPSPGNHDWSIEDLEPYVEYFELPNNERYYELRYEDLHLLALDSDQHEPDGATADSVQGQWARERLQTSDAAWQLVYFHHPPYSSASHNDNPHMQWPFVAWGADAVLAGHDHVYERQMLDGVPFLIEGRGGRSLYSLSSTPDPGSQAAFNDENGALLVKVQETYIQYEAWTSSYGLVDLFRVRLGEPLGVTTRLVRRESAWAWTAIDPGEGWEDPGFSEKGWETGFAPVEIHAAAGWLRQSFQVEDLDRITSASLELFALDGAIVYLNGQEIHRINLPKGDISPETPADAAGSETALTLEVPASLLVAGENVLAVELRRAATEDDGVALAAGMAATGGEALLASGASWRVWYREDAPPDDWKDLYFPDASWSGGLTPMGFGRAGTATTIAGSGDDVQTTLYARAVFTADVSLEDLLLRVARGDACVVYLNGVEVMRSNVSLKGAAISEVDDNWEPLMLETLVDPRLLLEGPNVLAAVVHRAAASDEMWFDLELIGLR